MRMLIGLWLGLLIVAPAWATTASKALPQRGKTPIERATKPSNHRADLQKGVKAELSGDYATALSIFKPLAEHGDAEAQFYLGLMYYSGMGVPQDSDKALYWFRKAAAQGYAKAQFNLGMRYDSGISVPQDYAKALYWYRKAAAQGYTYAQLNLGFMYYSGKGVRKDFVQAALWLILAKAGGGKHTSKLLSTVENKMTLGQIAEAQRLAREWWAKHHKR